MSEIPSIAVAAAGLVVVLGGWLHYLWLIPSERVPARPLAHLAAMIVGSALAVGGMVLGGSDIGTMVVAVFATGLALFFGYLLSRARQPASIPTFAVGQKLPAFEARTTSGQPFQSTELEGTRVLLKIFRGHW